MYGMKITYYHEGYERVVTDRVFGDIKFNHDITHSWVTFSSGGHSYIVNCKDIKSIEYIGEE